MTALVHPACRSRRGLAEAELPSDLEGFFADWLLFLDPPEHTRLRRQLMGMFTPQRIADLTPSITRIAEQLTPNDRDGEFDFVRSFARPFPVMVIADFIGMPAKDQNRIPKWANVIRGAFDELPEAQAQLPEAVADMRSYFHDLVGDRAWLSRLGNGPVADVVTSTPRKALAAHLTFLVFAGHDTTVHLLGSMLLNLAKRPDMWHELRRNPALVAAAVEEALRFESPVQKIVRRTAEPAEIGGTVIPADQSLVLLLGAANRDPAQFDRPDEFRLDRKGQGQIAFGSGPHLCLGRSLALLEANVALQVLLRAWARIAVSESNWHVNASFRGLQSLGLSWSAGQRPI